MFCYKCGKKLNDDAIFCDGCGAKVIKDDKINQNNQTIKEGIVHKCPYCGEILPSDSLTCPSCGHEIRDRKTTQSVLNFYNEYNKEVDDNKKMELIKLYPIPNNKEDIVEFMIFASSNIDVKYYVTNKSKESLSGAWLSKLEQCDTKAHIMFKDQSDLENIDNVYLKVKNNIKKYQIFRWLCIIFGFASLLSTFIIVPFVDPDSDQITVLGSLEIIFLILGIVLLILGFKKKKTNKEIALEKKEKLEAQARKDKIAEQKRHKNVIFIDDEDDDENN